MFDVDWAKLFAFEPPVAELVVRGTVIYLALFLAMRFLPRRTIGSMGAADILVVVMISETVGGGLHGNAESVTAGLVVAATVIAWSTLIDYLDYRFPAWHIAGAPPLQIILQGEMLRGNLARQQVTEDEVLSQLRQHGLTSPRDVASAYLEPDGHISVIVRGEQRHDPPPQTRRT